MCVYELVCVCKYIHTYLLTYLPTNSLHADEDYARAMKDLMMSENRQNSLFAMCYLVPDLRSPNSAARIQVH